MDPERMGNAETEDELRQAAGTGAGLGAGPGDNIGGVPEESGESFYGDTDVYPASSGLLPPTGNQDLRSPTEGLSEAEGGERPTRSPRQ